VTCTEAPQARKARLLRHAVSVCEHRASEATDELVALEPQAAVAHCLIAITTALGAALDVLAEEIAAE
jgi:hypothetical protein